MKYYIWLLLVSLPFFLTANPWGKDADLAYKPQRLETPSCKTPILGKLGESLIRFHQEVISPADGPRSNFKPSSSQYTLDAMRKYGFFKGFILGCDRLMRENDDAWVYDTIHVGPNLKMKYNPVP